MVVQTVKLPKFSRVGFHHNQPEKFVKSQWQSGDKSWIFLIYRWVLAAFFIGVTSYSWYNIIQYNNFPFWWIYLTNWGILICAISTTFGAFLTSFYHFGAGKIDPDSSCYKVYWFLYNVATVLAFVITIVYWSVLFNGRTSILDVLIHGGNSVGMMIDLWIVAHPMYIFHFLYSLCVGLVYLIFTIIYYFAGGVDALGNRYIYHVIDWSRPVSATSVSLGVAVLAIFLHIIACLIQKLRYRLYKKYVRKPTLIITNPQNPHEITQHV